MNGRIFLRFQYIIVLLVSLSACNALPEILNFSSDQNSVAKTRGDSRDFLIIDPKEQTADTDSKDAAEDDGDLEKVETQKVEVADIASQDAKTADSQMTTADAKSDLGVTAILNHELKTTQALVKSLISEWSALKPSVVRVIQLENDLSYLVDAINASSQVNQFIAPESAVMEITSAAELAEANNELMNESSSVENPWETSVMESFDEAAESPQFQTVISNEVLSIDEKFSAPDQAPSTTQAISPQLGRANPLPELFEDSARAGVSDSKFSNLSLIAKAKNEQVQTKDIVGPTKFSSSAGGDSSANRCANTPSTVGEFAIHLSSITQSANLKSAASNLNSAFTHILCNKRSRSLPVNVKGVEYLSIRFGPYENQQRASEACIKLRASGQYCKVTKFEGAQI